MKRMAREVAMYLKAYNKTGPGLKSAGSDLRKFQDGANKIFAAIAKAGAVAFTAVAVGAVAIGASFEQGMANTSSMFITAAKSAEELAGWTEQLAAKARELGSATAFTAREATDAMYALASGGLTANEVVAATDAVLKLAGATMTGMTEAAETTMAAMRQFGLEATDTDKIVNVFAAGIQNSMLNMERLSNAMVYAGPQMAAVGAKIEETVAALALLHNAGLKGSIAGTGLRMMMTKLLKPTEALKKVLKGITIEEDGMALVLKRLKDASLSAGQLVEMFGPRAFNAVKALTDAGAEGFNRMTDAVTGTNAATDMYAHQMNTVTNQWKIVRSAMEETGLAIYDHIRDPLMKVIKWFQGVIADSRSGFVEIAVSAVDAFNRVGEFVSNKLIPAMDEIKPAVVASLGVISGFADDLRFVVKEAFTAISNAASVALKKISDLTGGFGDGTNASRIFTAGLIGMTTALYGAATATGALNVALKMIMFVAKMNIWIRIIALVGAGIGIAVQQMGGFHAAWIKVSAAVQIAWTVVSGFFKKLWVKARQVDFWVAGIFQGLWDQFSWMGKAWDWVSKKAQVAGEWISGAMQKVVAWLGNAKEFVSAFGKTMNDVFTAVLDTIKDFASKAGSILADLGAMIVTPWKAKKIWEDMKKTLDKGLLDAFSGLDDKIAGYWEDANTKSNAKLDQIDKDIADKLAKIRATKEAALEALKQGPKLSDVLWDDGGVDRTFYTSPIGPDRLTGEAMGQMADSGPQMQGPFQEEGPLESAMKKDTEAAMDVMEEFSGAMGGVFASGWNAIIDVSKSGSEKWAAVFDGIKNKAWSVIGKIVQKTIWGEKIKLKSIIFGEKASAVAKGTGAAADAAATGVKVASAAIEDQANKSAAASGFFRAYASIPFVGSFLAAGAIAKMMLVLEGFKAIKLATGGLVNGVGGVDKIPAWLTNQEYVMPVAQTRQYLPILEAMRAGTFGGGAAPVLSAAGAASGPAQILVSVPITVGPGSLLIADDDLAIERFSKKIHDRIEDGIKMTYKDDD